MIRTAAAIAALLVCCSPALAQTGSPELLRASRAVAAIWRPFDPAAGVSAEAMQGACSGWTEELSALDASIPESLAPEALAQVRAPHGLVIVPTEEDPAAAFIFPNAAMTWFASGLGRISVLSEAQGYVGVEDAAGRRFTLQLGRQGRMPVMRVAIPDGGVATFVGCAPTLAP